MESPKSMLNVVTRSGWHYEHKVMLIDSHCHLDSKYLPSGPDEVLGRAKAKGVTGFVCVGVGDCIEPMEFAVSLAERRGDVLAVVGLHPHEAKAGTASLLERLEVLSMRPRVIGVGEIGLDYHYDFSPRSTQREVFRSFLRLAHRVRKPVVIHTREADADTVQILEEEKARDLGGVFHCFSSDLTMARRVLDLGFDLSFSGIVTFPSATELHAVARFVPSDRYLVETDSPYLAPVPYRGKKCEPAYVHETATRLAELRKESLERVATETSANFRRRFGVQDPFPEL